MTVDIKNNIFNEDTIEFMQRVSFEADCILTSPPYNTGKALTSEEARERHEGRYDIYTDTKTPEEYIEWTLELFESYLKTSISI